ncbi:MAG: hypothetical protein IPM97_15710 [Bdellovibrionaceae bacterium]|nr:hypothetical protein [Pseudobdellovibrionaceae bacterium]
MKAILIAAAISINAQVAFADISRTPIQNAEVIVFDATCTSASATEGYLTINMQMRAGNLFVRGNFFSYSEASSTKESKNWHLIPLSDCRKTQADLTQQAGRKIALSGQYFEQAYDAYEDIWGTCREHPMIGGTYPCKRGTRKVTKYHSETVLNVGPFYILNRND